MRNGFGAIELTDVTGAVDVENNNGKITLLDIGGPAKLVNRFGDIDDAHRRDATVSNTNSGSASPTSKGGRRDRVLRGHP